MLEPIISKEEVQEGRIEKPLLNHENNQQEMEDLAKMSRKDKRKAMKKMKRKQIRKEIAAKEKEEEEARLNDPEEQTRLEQMEQEEAVRRERERREFEERERVWVEAIELKKKNEAKEEEEKERNEAFENSKRDQQVEKENEFSEADNWEYVEEGPAEIIWQGNEIIVKKKRVKVSKKDADGQLIKEDTNRPTSNPLPPQSEAFADYKNASIVSAQKVLENVAQQVPNFGTEQDKAHCPFHLKTGACRFGQRCSRVHFYPDKSCTLLIKNMYSGPGLAWEQDEGLEYTDEEVEQCYEEFYEDVHTEFLKYGEIVNFKVCKNGAFHLRGNVYVHYKSVDSAVLAYRSMNGRYFASKQLTCEFVNITKWKAAICGEFMKSRFKTCSHGTACNFIHCFCNPGGDYEWADWDKSPPKYWEKKMAALFGYSDDCGYEIQMEQEHHPGQSRFSHKAIAADADRYGSRRSKSRQLDSSNGGNSGGSWDDVKNVRKSTPTKRHKSDSRKRIKPFDESSFEETGNSRTNCLRKSRSHDTDYDGYWSKGEENQERERERDSDKPHEHSRESSKSRKNVSILADDRTYEADSSGDWLTEETHHGHRRKSSRPHSETGFPDDVSDGKNMAHGDWFDGDRDREAHHSSRGSSRHRKHAHDHQGSNDRSLNTDTPVEQLDGDRNKEEDHSRKRRSSRQHKKASEYSRKDSKKKSDKTCSSEERHRSSKRKRSRHRNEVSESLDDEGKLSNVQSGCCAYCGTK